MKSSYDFIIADLVTEKSPKNNYSTEFVKFDKSRDNFLDQ